MWDHGDMKWLPRQQRRAGMELVGSVGGAVLWLMDWRDTGGAEMITLAYRQGTWGSPLSPRVTRTGTLKVISCIWKWITVLPETLEEPSTKRVGRSESCWVMVEGTSVGIVHLCKVSREVTAGMWSKGMVVGDFCGLSRTKRPSIRKKLWERKPQALARHVPTVEGGCGLFTLERLTALFPTEKVKHHEC